MTKDEDIILVNKPAGLTPLQAVELVKIQYPSYQKKTLSYAGRLDPMAEGLLLLLVDQENKQRHSYEHLPKTYDFQILIGYSTDTYDVMGEITDKCLTYDEPSLLSSIHRWTHSFQGKQTLPYPPYSSKSIQGKPLYWYTIHDKLSTISYPSQDIEIHYLKVNGNTHLSSEFILTSITKRLQKVHGDFRQTSIVNQWKQEMEHNPDVSYLCVSCSLSCERGVYVRAIVNKLSEVLRTPALTFTIKRTSIGPYTLDQALFLED